MKKILILISCSVIIAALVLYFTFTNLSKDSVTKKESASINVGKQEKGQIIEIEETDAKPVAEEFPLDMSEEKIRDAIHGMSHQKVKAEKKWGFIPLTSQRVKRLIEVVKENQSTYKNSTTYLEILERWANNDFSQVDKDHNTIWELQNGNVGRATGILSHEEEMEFIQEYYDVEGT